MVESGLSFIGAIVGVWFANWYFQKESLTEQSSARALNDDTPFIRKVRAYAKPGKKSPKFNDEQKAWEKEQE